MLFPRSRRQCNERCVSTIVIVHGVLDLRRVVVLDGVVCIAATLGGVSLDAPVASAGWL